MRNRIRQDKGSFLIEVLIAIVILGVVGVVIFNSISSSNLQNRKSNSNVETITRLTSAAEILAATPYSPCSQGNPNPYQQVAASIAPVEIAAIYGVTNSGVWSYCLNLYQDELLTSEGVASPWPLGENASRIQKVILRSPSGVFRSVFKSFDNKLGNYGLGGTFKTAITSIDSGALITNVTVEVGVPQTFKLRVLNPKSPSNNILYFITQGSSNIYSTPSIQATIDNNILTVVAPKFLSDGKTRNSSGRANIDVEAFDTVASLQATPTSLGLSVIIPPLQTVIKDPLVTLIRGSDRVDIQPVGVKGVYEPFEFKLISSSALPPGIAFEPSNAYFYGIPAEVWPSTTYTLEVTDSLNTKATGSFNMQVVDPLSISNLVTGRTLYKGSAISSFNPFITAGGLAPYSYTVSPALPAGLTLNESTGLISGIPTSKSSISDYTVTVSDNKIGGYVGQSKSHTFSIRVFDPLSITVNTPTKVEIQNIRASFTPVTASGGDSPYTFTVAPALPGGLSMDSSTGVISGIPTTVSAATNYTVTVRDSVSPTPNSATATFSLRIVPQLNIGTMITGRTFYRGTAITAFTPNSSPTGGVTPYTYSISPALPAGLTLNTGTGQISGTPTTGSTSQTYTFTIRDSALTGYVSQTDTGTFDMRVLLPLTATTAISTRVVPVGSSTSFTPVTASGGDSPYTFTVAPALPGGLSMDSSTGVISGIPTTVSAATNYTVTVRDSVSPTLNSATATFSLRIVPQLNIGTMITGRTFYRGTAITAFTPNSSPTGGVTPYTYSISPALPAGLTLNTGTGQISGTPTTGSTSQTYTFTIRDSALTGYVSQTDTGTFDMRVLLPLTATTAISTRVVPVGSSTSFTPVTASGGDSPYTFTVAPALPGGLSMDSSTGVISGIPTTVSAATNYTVTVRDSVSPTPNSATATFSLQIVQPLSISGISTGMTFYVGVAVSQFAFSTAGGSTPYTYSISKPLPSGLSFNTSTGLISGTPTVKFAQDTYTVTVQDSSSPSVTRSGTFDIRVLDRLLVTAVANSWTFSIGVAVDITTVNAQGGISPYRYTLTAGNLPAGLSFNTSTGKIIGTPTVAFRSASFTVNVNDSVTPQSNSSSVSFTITVVK